MIGGNIFLKVLGFALGCFLGLSVLMEGETELLFGGWMLLVAAAVSLISIMMDARALAAERAHYEK